MKHEEWTELTRGQQEDKIAELCGHTKIKIFYNDPNIPDYLNDLNAMNEAEELIPHDKRADYINTLCELFSKEQSAVDDRFNGIRYSAKQRAEAFVLVMDG